MANRIGGHWRGLALAVALAVCASAFAEVPVVRDGAPALYIDLRAGGDADLAAAVEDAWGALDRATGATLPTEPGPGLIPLVIGVAAETAGLPFALPSLDRESCYIRVTRDAIWLIGGSPLGARHGIYTLLHDLGFRWIMPGPLGECLPEGSTLALEESERVVAPDFRYRKIATGSGSPEAAEDLRRWEWRNRLHAPSVLHGHNLTATLARVAPYSERPDLYALLEGERKATQICTSNPEAVSLVIRSVSEHLDAHPEVKSYSLCPDDNLYFCECETCRALDPGHRDRGGMISVSDRYQVFLNQVLEGLADRHPNVLITTYAYNPNHTDPPRVTPVHPNTAVFSAPNVFCSIHGIGDTVCASQQDLRALLRAWRARTEHLYLFEYDPEPYCGGLPWPMWRAHAGAYPIYREIGVQGVFLAAQASWAPYYLSYYTAAQYLWDAGRDPEEFYRETTESFFGAAAGEMRAYYNAVEETFRAHPGAALWGMAEYPRYFPLEAARQAGAMLDEAVMIAVEPPYRARVAMVRQSHTMFESYLRIRASDYPDFAAYRADLARFESALAALEAMGPDLINAKFARAKSGAALSDRFAREQGFVNQWLLCGPFDNLGMSGHDRIYPPERELDLTATYAGLNDRPVQWRPSTLPDNSAYMRLADEYDVTDWVCAYAVCWVRNDGPPRAVEFRVGSNDSVKVFLNGDILWDNKVERVASVDEDVIPVTLPTGISNIMVKIGQAGYDWGFFFRIVEPGGSTRPAGLEISDTPPVTRRTTRE